MVAPLLIPLVTVIAAGVAAGAKGVTDFVHANGTANAAKHDHERAVEALEGCQSLAHQAAEEYGTRQLRAQAETIGRFVAWLERNERLVERLDRRVIAGVKVSVLNRPGFSGGSVLWFPASSTQGSDGSRWPRARRVGCRRARCAGGGC